MGERNNKQITTVDRYLVEYVELSTRESGSDTRMLQEILNEGSRRSHKLIGVAQDPTGKGLILFWDLAGFISG